jgi:hypothetical protein
MVRRAGVYFLAASTTACAALVGLKDIPDGPGPDASTSDAASAGDAPATDAPGPDGARADAEAGLPTCGAQRTLHIVAGNGGFAWFTLVWPPPAVITGYQATYAYDDPARAVSVGTAQHPLYARRRGSQVLWQGVGKNPMPSAFVAGSNETHTASPITAITANNANVVSAGAMAQAATLNPAIAVLVFGGLTHTPVAGAPAPTNVADIDAAINALRAKINLSSADEQALRPDPLKLATWYAANPPAKTSQLASLLLFAANLFKRGLVGTVVVPAFRDDPHGAFQTAGVVTAAADDAVGVLQGFYAELATANEPTCGYRGLPLSLADNVVLVVNGDTPKAMFDNNGWPDGTPMNANLLYVRSNGWLVPGWFGALAPGARTNFNPVTGAPDNTATNAESTAAAVNGALYAITRGDTTRVQQFSGSQYAGVRAASPP